MKRPRLIQKLKWECSIVPSGIPTGKSPWSPNPQETTQKHFYVFERKISIRVHHWVWIRPSWQRQQKSWDPFDPKNCFKLYL